MKPPAHVAIIMDGNGRWARQRGLPLLAGHRAGTENIRRVIKSFTDYGVRYLTLYAFSTENWGRPDSEIKGLFQLLREVIRRETAELHQANVQLRHVGTMDRVPQPLQGAIRKSVELTKNNTGLVLSLAFNYGGRAEIVDAIRRIVRERVPPDTIDAGLVSSYLYTAGLPDPDLIIRTGGEMRLSNFLIWQAAYAEYYATPTYWPDFGLEEVQRALDAYGRRQRRFGGR